MRGVRWALHQGIRYFCPPLHTISPANFNGPRFQKRHVSYALLERKLCTLHPEESLEALLYFFTEYDDFYVVHRLVDQLRENMCLLPSCACLEFLERVVHTEKRELLALQAKLASLTSANEWEVNHHQSASTDLFFGSLGKEIILGLLVHWDRVSAAQSSTGIKKETLQASEDSQWWLHCAALLLEFLRQSELSNAIPLEAHIFREIVRPLLDSAECRSELLPDDTAGILSDFLSQSEETHEAEKMLSAYSKSLDFWLKCFIRSTDQIFTWNVLYVRGFLQVPVRLATFLAKRYAQAWTDFADHLIALSSLVSCGSSNSAVLAYLEGFLLTVLSTVEKMFRERSPLLHARRENQGEINKIERQKIRISYALLSIVKCCFDKDAASGPMTTGIEVQGCGTSDLHLSLLLLLSNTLQAVEMQMIVIISDWNIVLPLQKGSSCVIDKGQAHVHTLLLQYGFLFERLVAFINQYAPQLDMHNGVAALRRERILSFWVQIWPRLSHIVDGAAALLPSRDHNSDTESKGKHASKTINTTEAGRVHLLCWGMRLLHYVSEYAKPLEMGETKDYVSSRENLFFLYAFTRAWEEWIPLLSNAGLLVVLQCIQPLLLASKVRGRGSLVTLNPSQLISRIFLLAWDKFLERFDNVVLETQELMGVILSLSRFLERRNTINPHQMEYENKYCMMLKNQALADLFGLCARKLNVNLEIERRESRIEKKAVTKLSTLNRWTRRTTTREEDVSVLYDTTIFLFHLSFALFGSERIENADWASCLDERSSRNAIKKAYQFIMKIVASSSVCSLKAENFCELHDVQQRRLSSYLRSSCFSLTSAQAYTYYNSTVRSQAVDLEIPVPPLPVTLTIGGSFPITFMGSQQSPTLLSSVHVWDVLNYHTAPALHPYLPVLQPYYAARNDGSWALEFVLEILFLRLFYTENPMSTAHGFAMRSNKFLPTQLNARTIPLFSFTSGKGSTWKKIFGLIYRHFRNHYSTAVYACQHSAQRWKEICFLDLSTFFPKLFSTRVLSSVKEWWCEVMPLICKIPLHLSRCRESLLGPAFFENILFKTSGISVATAESIEETATQHPLLAFRTLDMLSQFPSEIWAVVPPAFLALYWLGLARRVFQSHGYSVRRSDTGAHLCVEKEPKACRHTALEIYLRRLSVLELLVHVHALLAVQERTLVLFQWVFEASSAYGSAASTSCDSRMKHKTFSPFMYLEYLYEKYSRTNCEIGWSVPTHLQWIDLCEGDFREVVQPSPLVLEAYGYFEKGVEPNLTVPTGSDAPKVISFASHREVILRAIAEVI